MTLNKHWLDALLDYSPTILIISIKEIKGQKNKFLESLRQEDLHDLKYFQMDAGHSRDRLDNAVEILSCMNLSNFNLRSLVLHNLRAISDQSLEDFCLKHCGNIEQLELANCWDGAYYNNITGKYEGNPTNLGSLNGLISRTGSPKSLAYEIFKDS